MGRIKKILFYKFSKKQVQILGGFAIILVFLALSSSIFWAEGKTFSLAGKKTDLLKEEQLVKNPSPFSGISCKNNQRRAVGVVIAQYPETMPLSGISKADLVIEWPVANAGGVTRLLAVFQCNLPKEVGSIRSVRPYMVDIAYGFDLVLTSWGGARSAINRIEELKIDWLNGIENPAGAFFRKTTKYAPHNGFASLSGLWSAIKQKKMEEKNNFSGYKFLKEDKIKNRKKEQTIKIDYYYPVKYIYDKKTGKYFRYWNNKKAIDANTGKQAFARNVVLLKTKIGVLSPGVADAKVIGNEEAKIYQMGKSFNAKWQKKSPSGKLFFSDEEGKEVKFVPGPIWIEITHKF